MTKKTVFILLGVFLLAIFLSACQPHRWGPGCEIDGFAPEEIRLHAASDAVAGDYKTVNPA